MGNPAAADLLGVELRHLGVPIDHVVGPPLAPLTHAQRPDTRRAGETIRLQPVAGRWLDISRLDVTHSGGVGQGRLLLARDVTAQQRLETELRETNRQLTERVHEVTRLHHALYDASIRDRLTGLLNRHYAEEQLDRWLREGNGPTGRDRFALILVDIDHFKGVNDRYGHPAGDRVLKRVGEVLTRCSPADAVIARWGGEEFLVLFPSPSVPEAETCAQAIRGGIRAARTGYHSGWIAVTASIGVALFPEHGTTPEGLFKAADDALYRAKATGRDRVRNAS
jgi:diguanylate cyclase (GGDEF)-like protein